MGRKGFTLIEIIFVIVIIGILAAVAIPRFFLVGQHAHESNLISFVRTLNRTVGEELWAKSIAEGKNGSIKSFTSIKTYTDIPREVNGTDVSMANCGTNTYQKIAEANISVAGKAYDILCKDGNATSAPYFRLIRKEDNKILVSRD
ncbi:prepilin-type N-terminal cleavage/methylation domain-containing protein [Caminibacter pacificus]|uniref:Prepilin-type N-terminal cleavage/methylation domain-containing protein n=1 Tax=Caminibacter pacificus TaxID=1424653 RepID=A0AAJ4RCJ4_9BACT|nr:prepilin-type N-terminal cleavage/methylation domain-containing protein [Caminibacter pacificus]ROR39852.1 prepilin-type N-terminal cleavage/methylation domain-containing protein [Caminibacter pacificus]